MGVITNKCKGSLLVTSKKSTQDPAQEKKLMFEILFFYLRANKGLGSYVICFYL